MIDQIRVFLQKLYSNNEVSLEFTHWLTLSWRRPLSYRNQSIDLRSKSMDWFLYDNGLLHERVKYSDICVIEMNAFLNFILNLLERLVNHAKQT